MARKLLRRGKRYQANDIFLLKKDLQIDPPFLKGMPVTLVGDASTGKHKRVKIQNSAGDVYKHEVSVKDLGRRL